MEIYKTTLHFVFYIYTATFFFTLLIDTMKLALATWTREGYEGILNTYHAMALGLVWGAYFI